MAKNGKKEPSGSSTKAPAKKAADVPDSNIDASKEQTGNAQEPKPSRFPLGPSLSFLALLLSVAVALFLNQKKLTPPSTLPTTPKAATTTTTTTTTTSARKVVDQSKLVTLTPSTEMSRGYPNTLQAKLYEGLEPAVFLVLNDDDKENEVQVYWNNELKAIAAPGSRSRMETFLGHEFSVVSTAGSLNITVESPFVAVKVEDKAINVLPVVQESQIPELKFPPLPETKLRTTAKAIKVRNLSNKRYHNFWVPDNGGAPVYQGVIEPNSESTTTSYLTHTFRFTDLKDKTKTIFEFSVLPDQELYAYIDEKTADPHKLKSHLEEVAFAAEYKKKHNGRPWLSFYPHEPVKTFLWPADFIGQEHKAFTEHGPDETPFNFTLRVVSVRPRVFEVDYFVSDEETKYIIEQAKDRLRRSNVEMHGENGEIVESETRTSKNAWLDRGPAGGVLDKVFRRLADLLRVQERTLNHSPPDGCAENMQVVHYKNSAHYSPHHDWGVRGGPHTRLATVLLYLNQPIKGGETAFPIAKVGHPNGLVVTPKKGKAVLFYSQFPDGNVDDESLHEARPVTKGEKWLANVWVHDKIYWRKFSD